MPSDARAAVFAKLDLVGNCQAVEAANVLLQHPGGRVERLYWSTSAAEVMRANVGHYVALVTLRVTEERQDAPGGGGRTVSLKLLKPKEMLLLSHVYRLITTQEVTKAVQARKEEKQRKAQKQLLELRQGMPRGAAEEDDEETADPARGSPRGWPGSTAKEVSFGVGTRAMQCVIDLPNAVKVTMGLKNYLSDGPQ